MILPVQHRSMTTQHGSCAITNAISSYNKFSSIFFMKKLILFYLIFVVSYNAQSQARFGVQAGIIASSIKVKGNAPIDQYGGKPKMQAGFRAGIFTDIPLRNGFFFAPEINFVKLNGKYNNTVRTAQRRDSVYYRTKFNYVELPLNISYKISLQNGSKVLLGAGPVLGFRISEKTYAAYAKTIPGGGLLEPGENSISADERDDIYQTMQVGGNVLAAYELPVGLKISVQANHSFTNLDKRENYTSKSFYLAFNVGYKF